MAKKGVRRSLKRGFQRGRKLQRGADMDPALVEALRQHLGKDPNVADAQELQLAMTSVVLQNMVQARLAQWLETCLFVLRDEFGFDEKQLARFAREFMNRTHEQKTETPEPRDNGKF